MTEEIRWGVLGASSAIARSAVLPAIRASETGTLVAAASGSASDEDLRAWGGPRLYRDYGDLLADDEVEAVYLPLPNHLHRDWAIRAAEAGKHILCEKPLALNEREAAEMVAAAERNDVVLAEAFMYRHNPRNRRILEALDAGEIGRVRAIRSSFTFDSSRNFGNYRFDRRSGGGSLYDIGCYPLSAARMFLAAEPEAATVHAFFSPEHGGVDMMAQGLVEFADGVALTFDCGMWAEFRNTLEILGSEGRIVLPEAFGGHDFLLVRDGAEQRIPTPEVDQYVLEVDDMARAIRSGADPLFPAADAILNLRALDACLESADTRTRVSIPRR